MGYISILVLDHVLVNGYFTICQGFSKQVSAEFSLAKDMTNKTDRFLLVFNKKRQEKTKEYKK